MRLRKIKLSGFKSFVDPTTLAIPGDLTGIVGPNGCGKSNIIDAVMWVMGESSAKHLRGDSLTDVIFNGSSARKPVGQATVELLFDNSDGRVTGQYASYNEISIKRQLNRDGTSQYFLNNSRCRRRDITSIFLGTGIGPRSYSIIEQGMISRFIEAKPDELRNYIEEAAGISKYRERRRETELRIGHTKENINRLNDIRDELEKQLNHLQRQAKAAEKYQQYKQDERRLSAELLALDWRQLQQRADGQGRLLRERETAVEAARARVRQGEAALEQQRSDMTEATDAFNVAQSGYYQVGADIAQLEQKIEHTRERIKSLETDRQKLEQDHQAAARQREQDQVRLQGLATELERLAPELEGSRTDSEQAYDFLNQAEQAMQGWQSEWDAFNAEAAEITREEAGARTRLEHLELGLEDAQHRREQLQRERQTLARDTGQEALQQLSGAVAESESRHADLSRELHQAQEQVQLCRDRIESNTPLLDQQRESYQELRRRLASLEALQAAALGADQQHLNDWLQAQGYADAPRLAQTLAVEPQWMLALETVLGAHLQDLVLTDLESMAEQVQSAPAGELGVYSGAAGQLPASDRLRLADMVSAPDSLASLLAGVYIAEDAATALAQRSRLATHESLITPAGFWLGPDWLRLPPARTETDGTLQREQQLADLRAQVQTAQAELDRLASEVAAAREQLAGAEQALETTRDRLQETQQQLAEKRSTLAAAQARDTEQSNRARQVEEEWQDLAEQIEHDERECERTRARLADCQHKLTAVDTQRETLAALREQHRTSLEAARQRWQASNQESHGIALKLESISSQRASLEQGLQRLQRQLDQFAERLAEIDGLLASGREPLPALEQQLAARLQDKQAAEQQLTVARERLQGLDETLRGLNQQRSEAEEQVTAALQELETARLDMRDTQVRLETIREQAQSGGHDLEAVLQSLDPQADQAGWRESLAALQRRIDRLGPINLAAIEEYEQRSQRKTYLDSQHDDLTEALNTLENAIRKIDRETRTRFKETFDQLNDNLASLFPELFGGGHAYLELTGEDLLETGVTIMARPPGKRNSNIHLLSGGEKALTAVALVFAIFKLNPAPFCILDEVDAPLDDTNVGRFSELVRKMSAEIQFIVITHNKITMEITSQLIGVTMQEAGVSRLVSVDMDEAVAMAAAG